jgi:DNA-directed RNA polymerase specialized sigma24 family protein
VYNQNEDNIKSFIAQHQQKIFTLALYLVGQDQDRAYDVCASSFAEAIGQSPRLEREEVLIVRLIGITVEKCRNIKTIPTFDIIELLDISGAEKGQLLIVLKALQTLSFEQKTSLLLRFQLNMLYSDIGTVMQISDSNARTKTVQARAQLDNEIERILSNA